MKNALYLLAFLLPAPFFAQVTTCLGNNVTVCQGQNVTINHCSSGGGSGSNPLYLNNPTNVSLSDDAWSAAINIGFPFSFYGNVYTQCLIGSNGIVSFNISNAGGYCAWSLNGTPLPNTSTPAATNSAMMCYQDLNPANATSGPVQYQTIGTAPNRKFIVLYNGVTMFSCTNSCAYIGMVFHESTNIIDYYIGYKGQCSSWNSGLAIQGTMNNSNSVAHTTTGRNNTVWTASQDARRYTPATPTNTLTYTISTIPYQTVMSSTGGAMQWRNTMGQNFPYNNGQLVVNQVPPGTTGYFLVGTACGNPIGSFSDTTYVTRVTASVTASSTAALCGTASGTATATPGNGTAPFTFNWPSASQNTQTASNLTPGNYAVVMTDANGCTATATTNVQNVPATYSSSSTQVSCAGGNDGTATASMSPTGASTTYQWNDPNNQTTQTATGLSAGTYTCTITSSNGCSGTVDVTVTEIPGMQAVIQSQTDVTCHSKNDGIIQLNVTDGTTPYTFVWSGSASNSAIANDLYAGNQNVTVTDANGCSVTLNTSLGEPDALQINSLTPDTMICSESSITLTATGTGGSTAYTFSWFENGTPIGTGSSILVDPAVTDTKYRVQLSEACASPVDNDTMTIVFPTEIFPSVVPDTNRGCAPQTFVFTNTSNNSGEIDQMIYVFSNGEDFIVGPSDTVSTTFRQPGYYDVQLTVTSVYGCLYQATLPQIVYAQPRPVARLSTSANPTTIFETSIQLQDRSTNASAWEWNITGANPSFSQDSIVNVEYPSMEGNYPIYLKVTSVDGCTDSTVVVMVIESDLIFYSPNAFTPDGDQHNPVWRFYTGGIDLMNFQLTVYDRWGTKIWETANPDEGWDGTYNGKLLPQGAYNYRAVMQEKTKENPRIVTGSVHLLK